MNFSQKLSYLGRSVLNLQQPKICPFCGNSQFEVIDKKYVVTSLLKCMSCNLQHRHPKDDPEWLKRFYQKSYKIETHMMTTLPDDAKIAALKSSNFDNLRTFKGYLEALGIHQGALVADYGCSWGYNVFKLKTDGYNACGFEISVPRGNFGKEKLGVEIFSREDDLPENLSLLMSSHVIEHLTAIQNLISLSKKKLAKDGIFMAVCPNGSKEYRDREPDIFHVNWGFLHPNYLDVDFAKYAFRKNPYIILTGDWEYDLKRVKNWDGISQVATNERDGKELLIIAKLNIEI